MFYYARNEQTSTNTIADINIIASIISKTNLVFLNLFGRNQLNKITVVYNVAKSISKTGFSTTDQSAIVPQIIIKIKNIFSKVKNVFNIIEKYLVMKGV